MLACTVVTVCAKLSVAVLMMSSHPADAGVGLLPDLGDVLQQQGPGALRQVVKPGGASILRVRSVKQLGRAQFFQGLGTG